MYATRIYSAAFGETARGGSLTSWWRKRRGDDARSASGEWSPHENLAHLARHHAIFLERLHRIIAEDAPELTRYRAEEDSSWGEWSSLTTDEVISRLNTLRAEIVRFIKGLSDAEINRVGIHSLFGQMDLTHWVEFFLLHEAHHLYKLMIRLGENKTCPRFCIDWLPDGRLFIVSGREGLLLRGRRRVLKRFEPARGGKLMEIDRNVV